MIAFLTSSPCIYQAPRAILNPENRFIDNLREALPENPQCLFVCSDPDNPEMTDRFADTMAGAFAEAGIVFADCAVLDRRNACDAAGLITCSDLIILAGGHVPTQNAFFGEIALGELLKSYTGVLLGISAGTMNAAARVYIQPEEPGESASSFKRFAPGLGITEVNVLPHYQQVKDNVLDGKRLFEDITYADSWGECFFAFVDGTYLRVENGHATLFGEAYCIRNGTIEQISASGDIVALS